MVDYKLRLRFSKTGKAIYMSHLDLMSTLQRAFIRAGIKLKYTQGFNPHPSLSIALPLSVGLSSLCELIDFKTENYLLPEGLPKLINNALPEGIEITEAYIPTTKFNAIKWVKLNGQLYYNKMPSKIIENLNNRFTMKSIIITKKTKRGISEIDIAPHIKSISLTNYPLNNEKICYNNSGEITISVLLSAQEPSINPQNMMSALSGDYQKLAPNYASFTRIEVYDEDLNVFC